MTCEVATGDALAEAEDEALAEADALAEAEGEPLAEAEDEALAEADCDGLADCDRLPVAEPLAEAEAEALADADADADADELADADALALALGLGLGLSNPITIWPAAWPTTWTVLTDPIAVTALPRIWRGSESAAGDEHALTIAAATRQAPPAIASRFGAAAN